MYCETCGRVMERDLSSGRIVFTCPVGGHDDVEGTADDALIFVENVSKTEVLRKYQNLIRNAPFDRVNATIRRECTECGLPYMTLLLLGDQMRTVFRCKCGYTEIGSAATTSAAET